LQFLSFGTIHDFRLTVQLSGSAPVYFFILGTQIRFLNMPNIRFEYGTAKMIILLDIGLEMAFLNISETIA
jgi:hypothetical protein